MHSLPGRLHSLVYLREFRALRRRGELVRAEKRKGQADPRRREEGTGKDLRRPATVQRLFFATFQVSCYRALHTLLARFTRHVLSPLRSRLRSLRLYVYDRYGWPSRPSSRQLLDVLLHWNTGINGLHLGLRAESSLSLSPSFVSLKSLSAVSKSSLSSGGPPWKFIVLRRRHRRSRPSLGA